MEGRGELRDVLASIREEVPGIRALALISYDGFIIESFMPSSVDEDLMAAMGASVLSIAERMGIDLRIGDFELGVISGSDSYVLLTKAGEYAILLVLVSKDVKLGIALYWVKRAAGKVAELLKKAPVERMISYRWG